MARKFIDDVRDAIGTSLPTSSGIINEVLEAMYSSSSSAIDLARIIEYDPPLSAKLITVANSAFYSSYSKITNVQRAIVILGFNTVREILSTVPVLHYFFSTANTDIIDRPGLWYHSVGAARAAKIIADIINSDFKPHAYSIGLLHDIGRIFLAMSFPRQYRGVVALAAEKQCRIILAEQKLLKLDHTAIGDMLCEAWNLPEEIRSAVYYHHDLRGTSIQSHFEPRLCHLADHFSRKAAIGNPGDSLVPEPSRAAMNILGKTPERIQKNYDLAFERLKKQKLFISEFYSRIK